MKNPLKQSIQCWRWWHQLKPRGFFRLADACLQLDRVILPARFAYREAGKRLREEARLTPMNDGITKVELSQHELTFYWQGPVDNNLYFLIEQEFNAKNPHCYTTPPIQITPESRIFDVGACEGLFAFRLLKYGHCQSVTCFEPLKSMAQLIEQAAQDNGVADRITVEPMAVSDLSGPVRLVASDNPDACRIESCAESPHQSDAVAIRLDDYLAEKRITLTPRDLIKIDAEGTDLAVINGAADCIARSHPQIAVTTYHADEHVDEISKRLTALNPSYRLRLKGFSHWTSKPRPVLLQASSIDAT